MNSSENFGSSWSARTIVALSNRIISDTVIAVTALAFEPSRLNQFVMSADMGPCCWPSRAK